MSTKIIRGDNIVFENPYTLQNISLKHHDSKYKLIFDGNVKFNKAIEQTVILLGDFEITLSSDTESLLITKNGSTLFSISE